MRSRAARGHEPDLSGGGPELAPRASFFCSLLLLLGFRPGFLHCPLLHPLHCVGIASP